MKKFNTCTVFLYYILEREREKERKISLINWVRRYIWRPNEIKHKIAIFNNNLYKVFSIHHLKKNEVREREKYKRIIELIWYIICL